MSRELKGDERRLRAAGMDWPLHGLTMVGLNRLDDLQSCVESIVRDGVDGDLIEAGVWRGGASILMRATLDALGAEGRTVWVADSFQGFPMPDEEHRDDDELGVFDFLAVPLEEVRANFARFGCERGVSFAAGFFEEQLPSLSDRRWSMVRLDGDTYETTLLALRTLYGGLSIGGYLIVDDYGALEECRRAVDEFRGEQGISEPLEEVDWTCVRWRRESEGPIMEAHPVAAPQRANGPGAARAADRRPNARVPTIQELNLTDELEALRGRLAAAEADLEWLRGSPLRAPTAWLRERLSR
jgi:O-methyltransferase